MESDGPANLLNRVPGLRCQVGEERARAERELLVELHSGARLAGTGEVDHGRLAADVEAVAENVSFICRMPQGGRLFLGSRRAAARIVRAQVDGGSNPLRATSIVNCASTQVRYDGIDLGAHVPSAASGTGAAASPAGHRGGAVPVEVHAGLSILPLLLEDTADYAEAHDIGVYLEQAARFISEALGRGEAVLVHCCGGVSRSASVVLAYLVHRDCGHSLSLRDAYWFVQHQRHVIAPHGRFMLSLADFERRQNGRGSTTLLNADPAQLTHHVRGYRFAAPE